MKNPYSGDLCVIRDADQPDTWLVLLCQTPETRRTIATFRSFDEAAAFAIDHRTQRIAAGDSFTPIHFPDACPCVKLPREN